MLIALSLLGTLLGSPASPEPDSRTTPGAVDPNIRQSNIDTTICRPGYARGVRPPYAIMRQLKHDAMVREHPGQRYADFEFDHLIPISLGGALLDPRNTWLEPIAGQRGAYTKDKIEYVLWVHVCRHEIPLATAQRAIAVNWIAVYRRWNSTDIVFRHAQTD